MTCDRISLWMSAYVDQELPAKRETEMFGHLARCPACREFLRRAIDMKDRMKGELAAKAPAELGERMSRRLAPTRWSERSTPAVRLSVPLPAAIAGAAILFIMTLLLSPSFFAPEPAAAPFKTGLEDSTVELLVQRNFEALFERGFTE